MESNGKEHCERYVNRRLDKGSRLRSMILHGGQADFAYWRASTTDYCASAPYSAQQWEGVIPLTPW